MQQVYDTLWDQDDALDGPLGPQAPLPSPTGAKERCALLLIASEVSGACPPVRQGTCRDQQNVQSSALRPACSIPETLEAAFRLLRARRTHDTVSVVATCRGAHWRVWHPH